MSKQVGIGTIHDPSVRDRDQLEPPKKYNVIILNDDYTSMDFVVYVLIELFHHPLDRANSIMMQVHKRGKGVAGTYTREIAETKSVRVKLLAEEHEFPLESIIEMVE